MAKRDDDLTGAEMLSSTFRVYQRLCLAAQSDAPPDWESLGDDQQAAFAAGFEEMCRGVQTAEEGNTTYRTVAANANLTVQGAMGRAIPWEDLAPGVQLLWEHLVRHVVNLFAYDPEDDGQVETHEENIALVFEAKLRDLAQPEALAQPLAQGDVHKASLDNAERVKEAAQFSKRPLLKDASDASNSNPS